MGAIILKKRFMIPRKVVSTLILLVQHESVGEILDCDDSQLEL